MLRGMFCLLLVLVVLPACPGCKAKEARHAGFAKSELMSHDPTLPFNKVWRAPGFDLKTYNKLYIAPVNTDYMLSISDWQKGERKAQIEKDIKEIGQYIHGAITKAFNADATGRFAVLDAPGNEPGTLIVEVALTEIVPSKVTLNALGIVMPYGLGLPISAVRAMANDQSSVAIEARLRDANSGAIVAMLADREVEQAAPVTVRAFSWYSHAKRIIDTWAQQFVQIAHRKPGEVVKDADTFTLAPW